MIKEKLSGLTARLSPTRLEEQSGSSDKLALLKMISSPSAGCVQTIKRRLCMSSNESTFLVLTSSLWEIQYKIHGYAVTVGRSASECGASRRAPASCEGFLEG